MTGFDDMAVVETRLLHNVHRAATSLLASAATRATAPPAALVDLRDFLVAALRHHHESEDDILWPQLIVAAPGIRDLLNELSEEHEALDAALDRLDAVVLGDGSGREALAQAAEAVRVLVSAHLEREEAVLFPALAAYMSDQAWADFTRRVMASAPSVAAYLTFGFFEQVGSPTELAVVMVNLPEPVLALVPAMRDRARSTLDSLQDIGARKVADW